MNKLVLHRFVMQCLLKTMSTSSKNACRLVENKMHSEEC